MASTSGIVEILADQVRFDLDHLPDVGDTCEAMARLHFGPPTQTVEEFEAQRMSRAGDFRWGKPEEVRSHREMLRTPLRRRPTHSGRSRAPRRGACHGRRGRALQRSSSSSEDPGGGESDADPPPALAAQLTGATS